MRILVIPDLHNHIESADEWIARFPADRVVFLGDYFDNFGDSPETAHATALWLRESLTNPERIHLWGNHDLAYAFPQNSSLGCSGFTPEKEAAIRSVLSPHHWRQLRLVHFEEPNFLIVHAGLSRSLFEDPTADLTVDRINTRCAEALDNARAGIPDPLLGPEGITWIRWWNLEILPEFSQIVGHTPRPELQINPGESTFNVCLDTMGYFVGLIEDGEFFAANTHSGELTPVRPSAP